MIFIAFHEGLNEELLLDADCEAITAEPLDGASDFAEFVASDSGDWEAVDTGSSSDVLEITKIAGLSEGADTGFPEIRSNWR